MTFLLSSEVIYKKYYINNSKNMQDRKKKYSRLKPPSLPRPDVQQNVGGDDH